MNKHFFSDLGTHGKNFCFYFITGPLSTSQVFTKKKKKKLSYAKLELSLAICSALLRRSGTQR